MKITSLNLRLLKKLNRSILITSSVYTLSGIISILEEPTTTTIGLTVLGSIFIYDSTKTLITLNKRKTLSRLK